MVFRARYTTTIQQHSTTTQKPTYNNHTTNIRQTYNNPITNVQQTYNNPITNIQQPYYYHSTNIHQPYNKHTSTIQQPYVQLSFKNTTIQQPYNKQMYVNQTYINLTTHIQQTGVLWVESRINVQSEPKPHFSLTLVQLNEKNRLHGCLVSSA
jgi:hypothetical protein